MSEIEELREQVENLSGRIRGIELGLPLLAIALASRTNAGLESVAQGFKTLRGSLRAFDGVEEGAETPEAQSLDRLVAILEAAVEEVNEIRAERS